MNGFKIMADSYRKLAEQKKVTIEEAKAEIRVYEFLADCDADDFCRLVDSSALNGIIMAYLKLAIHNSRIDGTSEDKVINELKCLFDEKTAREVLWGIRM